MSEFIGIAINVLSSGLAFLVGVSLRNIMYLFKTRQSRIFWGPGIGKGRTAIFLGLFPSDMFKTVPRNEDFEPSGLVGLGDARALEELTAHLSNLGIKADVAYTNSQLDGQTRNNVILIGGDEANILVRRAFRDTVPSNLQFRTSPPLTLYDEVNDKSYRADWEGSEVIVDYGKMIRAVNPYAADRFLVMICGIYGFGTWGGVRLLSDPDFVRKCRTLGEFEFECIYKVLVHQGEPEFVTPLDIRPLSKARNDNHDSGQFEISAGGAADDLP